MIEQDKKIYLCQPNRKLLTQLNGIQLESVEYSEHLKDFATLSFTVDKYIEIDGVPTISNGYEDLKVFMELYLEDIGYFQMQEPSSSRDGMSENKQVKAYGVSKEFEDKDLTGFCINKGTTDSLEYLASGNINAIGFAKEPIIFYNPGNPELSLMHLVLQKIPGWSIGSIDPLLAPVRLSLTADGTNLFAFFNSQIAPKAKCIFYFDILKNQISAYSKDSIGSDTNIFIGFRNLANSIAVSCNEDTVYTRFTVMGDEDLDIRPVNFNERWITDFNHFKNTSYMSEKLIHRLEFWEKYRSEKRPLFIDLSKKAADLESKIQGINLRVPNDGCNDKQWDDMTEELLFKNQKYYNALLTALQVSVDLEPEYTKDEQGNKTDYIPWKKPNGSINHEAYLELLYKQANGYGGYYTYLEILNYILPNIQIAIDNLAVPDDKKKDFNKEYETNWDLYGIKELEGKRDFYLNSLKSLENYQKPWSELTDEEKAANHFVEAGYNIEHLKYLEQSGYLGSELLPGTLLFRLKKLQAEVAELSALKDSVIDQQRDLIKEVSLENDRFDLDAEQLLTINRLLHDKVYTNSNIVTTSVDTALTRIDVQETLYQDGLDKLSEVSQPQYSFETDMDNLLSLEEFKDWKSDLVLGNFIRLGIRDDYSVKLRLTGRTFNPCITTPKLTVEFSNMITSRSGRTDLTEILGDENERGSVSDGISLGTGDAKNSKDFMTEMLQMMVQSNLFQNKVSSIAGSTISSLNVETIFGNYAKYLTIDVGKLTGKEADFEKLFSEYIDADYISSRVVIGEVGEFKNLIADVAKINQIIAGNVVGEEGLFINLTTANVHITDAVIKGLIASKISVADLMAHSATAELITLVSTATGQPSIAFKDGTQQFYDDSGNIRVQIGQDGQGEFNFVVRGTDGTTALFDENGVTTKGIADGLIKNNMLGDNQISKNKLNFPLVETDENGKISITEISDGSGGSFGVKYTEFTESVTAITNGLDEKIENALVYRVELQSSNGYFFKKGKLNTTLSCLVWKGNEEITNKLDASLFSWIKKNSDGTIDDKWDVRHVKTLELTDNTLELATFECLVDVSSIAV